MNKTFDVPRISSAGYYDQLFLFPAIKQTPERVTNHYEFELPTEKSGTAVINGVDVPIDTDKFFCFAPGVTRYTKKDFKCLYFHFDLEDCELADHIKALGGIVRIENYNKIKKLMLKIIDEFSKREKNELKIYSIFLALLVALESQATGAKVAKSKNPISSVIDYIEEHISEKITLEDLSAHTKYNPVYLHRLFKSTLGQTLGDYILNKRIELAKKLVCYSNKSMTEIVSETGFSSQAYFNYVFKKEVGYSPLNYKKEYFKNYSKIN